MKGGIRPGAQVAMLRKGIRILDQASREGTLGSVASRRAALEEQPFDAHLLAASSLYRLSRRLYVAGGGRFRATLVSSPRTLSSPILLEQVIEYSPIERELVWAATDPGQARDSSHLLTLRTFSSSLFHEQSHRLLWRMMPPPPTGGRPAKEGLRRYLNFVESLVIVLDMALGDELGPSVAPVFYLSGVTYDPGTGVREGMSRREYRNYLQAALHATYLLLERYEPRDVPKAIRSLFPSADGWADRAAERAGNLDSGFVHRTNPVWQERHREAVIRAFRKSPGEPLILPEGPLDHRRQYLLAEQWFDAFGL